jgi:hypothetical protein
VERSLLEDTGGDGADLAAGIGRQVGEFSAVIS